MSKKSRERPPRSIGLDTSIMTDIVAESVTEKANRLANLDLNERELGYYAGRLVEQAEVLYHSNEGFRSKVREHGSKGRDYLYAFMQHWITSLLLKDTSNRADIRHALIDSGFSMGND